MAKFGMTAALMDQTIAEAIEGADQTFGGNVPREFHAASTGINSSLT